ncbi:MAG: sensor histidine kinase [Chloroflexi bacterium]|nr:MAG: sensor histidine kinase [Chloroflexota bacterium]
MRRWSVRWPTRRDSSRSFIPSTSTPPPDSRASGLQNLIRNAIKYSPGGGHVNVRVRASDGRVNVSVRDRGIGLQPEEAEHVFEQFYRAAAARRLEGSGLGLYICQAIIAAHGGHIDATSPGPGKGTTFTFDMPFKHSTDRS